MKGRANTTISVWRGTETNSYGDEVDSVDAGALHLRGIPAALVEQGRRSYNPVDGQRRTIRTVICRVTSGTDIQQDDRVRDDTTLRMYLVTTVHEQASPVHQPDLTIELELTTG
jgi:hypothetical protein